MITSKFKNHLIYITDLHINRIIVKNPYFINVPLDKPIIKNDKFLSLKNTILLGMIGN